MSRVILRERIPPTDPRLGRRINHDSESRRYAYNTSGLSIVSAQHQRRLGILDQGAIGACTGFAGIGCLGTDPFYATVAASMPLDANGRVVATGYTLNEAGAVKLYSDATAVDDYPGQYKPDDTGSDGLTIAKVLTAAGEISGYQHTFSLDAALKALGVTPVIVGTSWYEGMFTPEPDGRVRPSGPLAGGHEYVADGIDAERQRVWCSNSWGSAWGQQGRFYLSFADFGTLLAQDGDVTVFVPLTQPPPTPAPDPDLDAADLTLAMAFYHNDWIHHRHVADNHTVQVAAARWLKAKGL